MRLQPFAFQSVLALISLAICIPNFALGVTLRDDRSRSKAIANGRFPSVGYISHGCTGTLVAPDKVLTAAHCIPGVVGHQFILGPRATVASEIRTITGAVRHPKYKGKNSGFDIGILFLDQPITSVAPRGISGKNASGKTGTFVGYGDTGNGFNLKNGNAIKRYAQSKIDVLVPRNFSDKSDRGAYYLDFDRPGNSDFNTLKTELGFSSSSKPLNREGDTAPGDSGGPLLSGGAIVGVTSAGFNPKGSESEYGSIGLYAAIVQPENISFLQNHGLSVSGRGSNTGDQPKRRKKSSGTTQRASRDGGPEFGYLNLEVIDGEVFFVDEGAIQSAVYTGLPVAAAMSSEPLRAASIATRNVNGRLDRLQARRTDSSSPLYANDARPRPSGVSRFLAMAETLGVDPLVALGLEDPVELPSSEIFLSGGPFMTAAVIPVQLFLAAEPVEPSGKEELVIVDDQNRVWEIFASGSVGNFEQETVGQDLGFDTETGAGSVGVELDWNETLSLGLAVSYVDANTDMGQIGEIETEGYALSAYASFYRNGFFGDLHYAFGQVELETDRNTLLGATAVGETDAESHVIDLNFGYNFETPRFVHGPTLGLHYGISSSDAFSERGGGAANLEYAELDNETLTSLIGWQITGQRDVGGGKLTAQVRLGWGHEYLDDLASAGVGLVNSPFVLPDGSRAGDFGVGTDVRKPGSDFLGVGVGIDYSLGANLFLGVDYETRLFWDEASEHFGSLRLGIQF
ncbi:MAG: autotransporter domain-containing protein [Verrucomicrobiota bacterium]